MMKVAIVSAPRWSIWAVIDPNVKHAAVGTSALFAFTINPLNTELNPICQ